MAKLTTMPGELRTGLGAVLSDTKAKYSGWEVRHPSSIWSLSPEEPCVLWTQTLSAPKAVASLLLPGYHCVISHFCHITETANETAKARP